MKVVLKLGQKWWKVHMGNLLVSFSSAQNNKTGFNKKARDAKGSWRTHFALCKKTQAYAACNLQTPVSLNKCFALMIWFDALVVLLAVVITAPVSSFGLFSHPLPVLGNFRLPGKILHAHQWMNLYLPLILISHSVWSHLLLFFVQYPVKIIDFLFFHCFATTFNSNNRKRFQIQMHLCFETKKENIFLPYTF